MTCRETAATSPTPVTDRNSASGASRTPRRLPKRSSSALAGCFTSERGMARVSSSSMTSCSANPARPLLRKRSRRRLRCPVVVRPFHRSVIETLQATVYIGGRSSAARMSRRYSARSIWARVARAAGPLRALAALAENQASRRHPVGQACAERLVRSRCISSRSVVLSPSPRQPSSRSACAIQLRIAWAVGSNCLPSAGNKTAFHEPVPPESVRCEPARPSGAGGRRSLPPG